MEQEPENPTSYYTFLPKHSTLEFPIHDNIFTDSTFEPTDARRPYLNDANFVPERFLIVTSSLSSRQRTISHWSSYGFLLCQLQLQNVCAKALPWEEEEDFAAQV